MPDLNYIGYWSGYGRGVENARVHVRIYSENQRLRAFGLIRTISNEVEVAQFMGKEESDTKAFFELTEYATDNPRTLAPLYIKVVANYKAEPERLDIQFATDEGNKGTATLYRARTLGKLQLYIPAVIHTSFRCLKKYIRFRLKYFYLLFLIILSSLSALGKLPSKINIVEVVVLLIPLFFMFIEDIRRLVSILALRRLGPIEFQEQKQHPSGMTLKQVVQELNREFKNLAPMFFTLTRFLVPNTKTLLRLIIIHDRPLSEREFSDLASSIGIAEDNIPATRDALINSKCITTTESSRLVATDIGRRYLLFEDRITQLYRNN